MRYERAGKMRREERKEGEMKQKVNRKGKRLRNERVGKTSFEERKKEQGRRDEEMRLTERR